MNASSYGIQFLNKSISAKIASGLKMLLSMMHSPATSIDETPDIIFITRLLLVPGALGLSFFDQCPGTDVIEDLEVFFQCHHISSNCLCELTCHELLKRRLHCLGEIPLSLDHI